MVVSKETSQKIGGIRAAKWERGAIPNQFLGIAVWRPLTRATRVKSSTGMRERQSLLRRTSLRARTCQECTQDATNHVSSLIVRTVDVIEALRQLIEVFRAGR